MTHYVMYKPHTDLDGYLVSWFIHLQRTGDLYSTFFPVMHTFSGFLAGFQHSELVLAVENDTVWAATWVEKQNDAPFIGVWIDEPYRGSFRAAKFLTTWHSNIKAAYPTTLCLTQQPGVVALAEHLGYTNHGSIPALWAGEPAYLLSSTKEFVYGQRQSQRFGVRAARTH